MIGKEADDCGVLKLFNGSVLQHNCIISPEEYKTEGHVKNFQLASQVRILMNFASQNLKNTSQIAKCELLIRTLAKGQC